MSKASGVSPSIDRQTIGLFWQAGWRYKSLLAGALLYPIGVLAMSTLAPLYVGRILATLGRSGGHPTHYLPYFASAAIIGVICNRFGFNRLLSYQAKVMRDLQTRALDALLKRSVGFHNNNVGGKLVSDAIDYSGAFGTFANTCFGSILPLVITLVSGSIVIFWQSWPLGLLVVGMAIFTIGSGIFDSHRREGLRKYRLIATKAVTSHLADSIMNIQTVKTFAHEDQELSHSDQLSEKLMGMRVRDWGISARRGSDRIAVLMMLQGLFVVTTVKLIQHNPALLGIGIFAFSYTITLSNRLFDVNTMMRSIEDALLQASPMTEILLQTPEIQDKPGAPPLHVEHGDISLNNVEFHYHDSSSQQSVFHNLKLTIKPGEKIGLVGPSGGGKSTLTRLLLRFEDIDGGEILIDNQNIADTTQTSLRRAIAYVPQEPLLFHRPVDENIAYGATDAKEADIVSAAKAAHADAFIKQLPKGYKTVVGERGVKLSGGQRQRIAIARAILKDAPILVLDEATSALDSGSEKLIQSALWQLMRDKTALVIAHRLSTIQRMDRIVVLDNGKIIEEGTHQSLLEHQGLYAKLWAHQSGGFIEE